MKTLRKQLEDICTYHSELGEGTSGYLLSNEQFDQIEQAFLGMFDSQVLGRPIYGFEDMDKWNGFIETYFTREGTVNDEHYSAAVNKHLSTAAMLHTIEEIRQRIKKMLGK